MSIATSKPSDNISRKPVTSTSNSKFSYYNQPTTPYSVSAMATSHYHTDSYSNYPPVTAHERSSDMYASQMSYHTPSAHIASEPAYNPQLSLDHYPAAMDYNQWYHYYPTMSSHKPSIHEPQQQHYITDWVKNVENNTINQTNKVQHQMSYEEQSSAIAATSAEAEDHQAEPLGLKRSSSFNSGWQEYQPLKKRAVWNAHQSMARQESYTTERITSISRQVSREITSDGHEANTQELASHTAEAHSQPSPQSYNESNGQDSLTGSEDPEC